MKQDEKIITAILSGRAARKYEGKEVVVCGGKIYPLPDNDNEAAEFFNKLIEEHPKITPTLTFVPRHGAYIL